MHWMKLHLIAATAALHRNPHRYIKDAATLRFMCRVADSVPMNTECCANRIVHRVLSDSPCSDADAQGNDIKCLTTIVADSACGIVQYRTGPTPSSRRVCLVYAFELITTGSIQCNNNVELFCRPIASTHSWEEKKAHKDLKELKYRKEERSRSTSIMHAQLEFNAYKHHACPTGIQCSSQLHEFSATARCHIGLGFAHVNLAEKFISFVTSADLQ